MLKFEISWIAALQDGLLSPPFIKYSNNLNLNKSKDNVESVWVWPENDKAYSHHMASYGDNIAIFRRGDHQIQLAEILGSFPIKFA